MRKAENSFFKDMLENNFYTNFDKKASEQEISNQLSTLDLDTLESISEELKLFGKQADTLQDQITEATEEEATEEEGSDEEEATEEDDKEASEKVAGCTPKDDNKSKGAYKKLKGILSEGAKKEDAMETEASTLAEEMLKEAGFSVTDYVYNITQDEVMTDSIIKRASEISESANVPLLKVTRDIMQTIAGIVNK